jgi:outer membrane protein assembly factor BamB
MRGKVDAAPAVAARPAEGGELVIVADAAGKIVALAAGDGEPLWEFDAGGGFSAGAAVAAGKVVLASDDGTVWCFGTTVR